MRKNTKTLKLVACMSLIVALAISALSLSVRATHENTHGNTGDQASDIVGVASTQVGYYEGGDGYTKYGDWYGLPYSDWCAMFVSWCANQAGVSTDVFPSFALCSAGADWFISQGRFHYAGSYAPQAGDLIFYSSYGNIYHVGLVTGSDGSNVYSIEGNYNEAVYNVSYPLSYGDIMGYATPAYGTQASVVTQDKQNVEEDSAETPEEVTSAADTDENDTEVVEEQISEEAQTEEESSETVQAVEENEEVQTANDNQTESDTDVDSEDVVVSDISDNEETETSVDSSSDDITTDSDKKEDKKTSVSILCGDANGDGTVDSADALLIQRYLAGKIDDKTEKFNILSADADISGEIDVEDALFVLELSIAA